jgi:putative ATP-dependent endonuclease of the OLD family
MNMEVVEKPKQQLMKLTVSNFRCIGEPVEIELDQIVVLVGPNNSGKSSVLRAYETIMSAGSKESQLSIDDFQNGQIVTDSYPTVELLTKVSEDKPGDQWCEKCDDDSFLVREKWIWTSPGDPKRLGFNVDLGRWAEDGDKEKVPWGAAAVANARRPQPHRVNAFDPPESQTDEILRLLDTILENKIKELTDDDDKESKYSKLVTNIRDLQSEVVKESEENIKKVQDDLSGLVAKVFPKHIVKFDPQSEEGLEKSFSFFTAKSQLRMGPKDGFLSTIDKQGSGARRTLLWTTLKMLADQGIRARNPGSKAKKPIAVDAERPHVLLLDEPELCLHPSAIREASNLLYELPDTGNWQIMLTTHSPCFIDFSKDNTTIVRVEFTEKGDVTGTTIYRPEEALLDDDDRKRLKLLNLCDPYMAEFFFGGKTIIVEGDTEHTAFSYLKEIHPDEFKEIHIVRARGKATIVSLIKILNHFGASYSVLHDSDSPTCERKDGTEMKNPAWTMNANILEEAKKSKTHINHVVSVPNFEGAYFDEELKSEKPYTALSKLRDKGTSYTNVITLFNQLCGNSKTLPANAIAIDSKLGFDEQVSV